MRLTIEISDELALTLQRDHPDLDVDAVCEQALRDALRRHDTAERLEQGPDHRIVLYDGDAGRDVSFQGRDLGLENMRMAAFLTAHGRLAIYDRGAEALHVFDDFDQVANDPGWRDTEQEVLAEIAAKLGEPGIDHLDI